MTKSRLSQRFFLGVLFSIVVFTSLSSFLSPETRASVRLPRVFGNDMVLQRDSKTPVWGWASPGEKVVVDICGQRKSTVASEQGTWRIELAPQPAGGPYELTVRGTNTITYSNVYYGEVWICAGQSNIVFPLKRSKSAPETAQTATYPQLRFLTVPALSADEPQNDFSSKWEKCSPKTAPDVSAVAFYFGQYLHEKLQVAVGVIIAARSGSTGEAWVARDELAKFPELEPLVEPNRLNRAAPSQKAGSLFNGMIKPICPYAIRGVVWYQGESNANRAWQYRTLFPILIANWREEWGRGDFPFIYVQLPNFMEQRDAPASSAWAELREAQHKALSLRNVAEVVTIDVGEAQDLHPKDKKTVGVRLANAALGKFYEKNVPWTGPEFKSMIISDNKAVLTFTHAAGGLVQCENAQCDGSVLQGFAIAGSDRKFYWADARIENGDQVVVSSPDVPRPVSVRYAWADNPACNLTNESGLPASPFRTDDWTGVTVDAR